MARTATIAFLLLLVAGTALAAYRPSDFNGFMLDPFDQLAAAFSGASRERAGSSAQVRLCVGGWGA